MTLLLQGAGLQTAVSAGDPIGDALRAVCVGCWTLNETSSPFVDLSPSNNSMIASPGVLFESIIGKINKAIGYTDTTSTSSSIQPNSFTRTFDQWSLSAWIKIHTTFGPDNQSDIAAFGGLGLTTDGNDDVLIYATPPYTLGSIFPIAPSDWHHIVITSDFTHHDLYIDNVHKDTLTKAVDANNFFPTLLPTAGWNNTDTYAMDEVELYSKIISTDEITYLWNDGAGRTLYP